MDEVGQANEDHQQRKSVKKSSVVENQEGSYQEYEEVSVDNVPMPEYIKLGRNQQQLTGNLKQCQEKYKEWEKKKQ